MYTLRLSNDIYFTNCTTFKPLFHDPYESWTCIYTLSLSNDIHLVILRMLREDGEVEKTRFLYNITLKNRGYRKRIFSFWNNLGVFEVLEERLADHARHIRLNGWVVI